jgi:hypothetical protein
VEYGHYVVVVDHLADDGVARAQMEGAAMGCLAVSRSVLITCL